MTENEEKILKVIKAYLKENNVMPARRFIQRNLGYKSINSITQYFKSLEKKGYLKRNNNNQLVASNNINNNNLKRINIINLKNKTIEIVLNKKKNYIGYKLNNNYFQHKNILKDDILIIEKKNELHINDIGLFIIDNKLRIMEYDYRDGFYLLNDNEKLILNHVKIIGKVIKIIRKI